jgi:hybrid cluster-associated redox disulfide protein
MEEVKMAQVTKDMTFAAVMRMHPDVVKVLSRYNLGCIGCMGAQNESLEQGCAAHGINVDDILADINALFV